jgi:uncharacterized protein YggE
MQHPILSLIRLCASVSLVLALVASRADAQANQPNEAVSPAIRVTGEASVTSRPDRVELDLGVVTRGASSQQASAENARTLQNVLAALRKTLGAKANTAADIETVSYALEPNYQYPQNGEPKIVGYTATNVVRVTEDDLTNVGAVIDAATRAGANQIERIRFTLKDEAAAKASALRGAALDARAKANSLAGALGVQITRIRSIDEASPTSRPLFDVALRSTAQATPVLPRAIETNATVTLVIEFANHG